MRGHLPRLPVWIVTRFVRPELAEDIIGDLEERWRDSEGSRLRAAGRVWQVALAVAWQATRERLRREHPSGTAARLSSVRQDAVFALRLLRRQPLAAGAIVVTLTVAIGATTALFSVVNAWVLRPLPFATPERLVAVWETIPSAGIDQNTPAPAVLQHWRARVRSLDALAAMTNETRNLTGRGDPVRLVVTRAEPALLPLLGLQPVRGRLFDDREGRAPAPPVVLLSYDAWQRFLAGSEAAVGARLTLDGESHEVVGVLPRHARPFGLTSDVWTPLAYSATEWENRNRILRVVGRLREGVDVATASAEIDALSRERSDDELGGRVVALADQTLGDTGAEVMVLFGASGFVLLVACANIASLTLVRLAARRRELAARLALGASRGRVMRQILVESLTLSVVGGALGMVVAAWAARAVVSLAPASARLGDVDVLDPRVSVFAIAATALTALLFGLLPAWQSGRTDPSAALRSGGRGASAGRRRAMSTLVAVEIALTMLLVVATGLVTRSFVKLTAVDLGFDPATLILAELPRAADGTAPPFFEALERLLIAAPGVEGVALSQGLPLLAVGSMGSTFPIQGREDEPAILAYWRVVNAGYFHALGVPLVAGRPFGEADRAGAPGVAIVSEDFARRAWPDGSALGRTIGWGSLESPRTVVGVAGNVRQSRASAHAPHVYMPYQQAPNRVPAQIALRSTLPAAAAVDLLRRTVSGLDPNQPVDGVRTGEAVLWESMGRRRFHLTLFGLFAGTAIVLAAVGLYGVLAFTLSEQRRELGIRAALGATPSRLQWQWWRRGLGLVAAGVTLALASAWAAGSLIEGFLFQIDPHDPLALAGGVVLVVLTASAAIWIPARRAAVVDPVEVLRREG